MPTDHTPSWIRTLFSGSDLPNPPTSPSCLIAEHRDLSIEAPHRRATISGPSSAFTNDVGGERLEAHAHTNGARYLAQKLLRKPEKASIHTVSRNLDSFFDCFSARHAIIDPLTGRFNLSEAEHSAVVSILNQMMEKCGDSVIPATEFENPMLPQKWSFTSKGVLSLSVCQRIVHLARVYAKEETVDCRLFVKEILRIDAQRREKWIRVLVKIFVILAYYVCGCLFYGYYMHLSIISSIYFITCTVSTLGPGDIVPIDDFSRMFTIFYAVIGIVIVLGIITGEISVVLSTYQDRVKSVGNGIIEISSPEKRQQKIFALYALHIFYACLLIVLPIAIGTVLIYYTYGPSDSMTLITCIYTAATISASIGYGDFVPESDVDRLLISLYIFLGISCVSAAIVQIGSLTITVNAYRRHALLRSKRLAVALIAQLDSSGLGVDKFEFLAAMLVALEKVGPSEISDILHQFDLLDDDKKGVISLEGLLHQHTADTPPDLTV